MYDTANTKEHGKDEEVESYQNWGIHEARAVRGCKYDDGIIDVESKHPWRKNTDVSMRHENIPNKNVRDVTVSHGDRLVQDDKHALDVGATW